MSQLVAEAFTWDTSKNNSSIKMKSPTHAFMGGPSTSSVVGDIVWSSGVHMYRIKPDGKASTLFIGVAPANTPTENYKASLNWLGGSVDGWSMWGKDGTKHRMSGSVKENYVSYAPGVSFQPNDLIDVICDLDKRTLSFAVNGKNLGVAHTNVVGPVRPCISALDAGVEIISTGPSVPSPAPKPVIVEEKVPSTSSSSSKLFDVFISYNHGSKELAKKLRQALGTLGYRVWIDEENISGDLFMDMANGIENSHVLISFWTLAYQNSVNCKNELEFAFRNKLPIIPLKAEAGFTPKSWLGLQFGSLLYTDISSDNSESWDAKVQTIVSRVKVQLAKKQ